MPSRRAAPTRVRPRRRSRSGRGRGSPPRAFAPEVTDASRPRRWSAAMLVAASGALLAACSSSSTPVPEPDPAAQECAAEEAPAASATAAAPAGAAPTAEPARLVERPLSGRTTLVWVRGRGGQATTYFYETGRPAARRP